MCTSREMDLDAALCLLGVDEFKDTEPEEDSTPKANQAEEHPAHHWESRFGSSNPKVFYRHQQEQDYTLSTRKGPGQRNALAFFEKDNDGPPKKIWNSDGSLYGFRLDPKVVDIKRRLLDAKKARFSRTVDNGSINGHFRQLCVFLDSPTPYTTLLGFSDLFRIPNQTCNSDAGFSAPETFEFDGVPYYYHLDHHNDLLRSVLGQLCRLSNLIHENVRVPIWADLKVGEHREVCRYPINGMHVHTRVGDAVVSDHSKKDGYLAYEILLIHRESHSKYVFIIYRDGECKGLPDQKFPVSYLGIDSVVRIEQPAVRKLIDILPQFFTETYLILKNNPKAHQRRARLSGSKYDYAKLANSEKWGFYLPHSLAPLSMDSTSLLNPEAMEPALFTNPEWFSGRVKRYRPKRKWQPDNPLSRYGTTYVKMLTAHVDGLFQWRDATCPVDQITRDRDILFITDQLRLRHGALVWIAGFLRSFVLTCFQKLLSRRTNSRSWIILWTIRLLEQTPPKKVVRGFPKLARGPPRLM